MTLEKDEFETILKQYTKHFLHPNLEVFLLHSFPMVTYEVSLGKFYITGQRLQESQPKFCEVYSTINSQSPSFPSPLICNAITLNVQSIYCFFVAQILC